MESRGMLAVLGLLFLSGAHTQICAPSILASASQYSLLCCNAKTMSFGICCYTSADQSSCYCKSDYPCSVNTLTTTPPPTTTPFPTPTPTTATARRLCPSVPLGISGRLLNAEAVTNPCLNKGVVGLYADLSNIGLSPRKQFCNAVVYYNGVTNSRELVMDAFCQEKEGIELLEEVGASYFLESQGQKVVLKDCYVDSKTTVNGIVKRVLDPVFSNFLDSLNAQCDNTACAFNSTTMSPELQVGLGCYLMSFGAVGVNLFNPQDFVTGGLRMTKAQPTLSSNCESIEESAICFRLDEPAAVCEGDTSAALFCPLSTGEEAFMGLVNMNETKCLGTTPSFVSVRINDIGRP